MKENEIGTIVVDCAISVHRELGPGLLETVYEVGLKKISSSASLREEKIKFQHSHPLKKREVAL